MTPLKSLPVLRSITLISPSNGGKSTFVYCLKTNSTEMFKETFSNIVYCFSSTWQTIFDKMAPYLPNIMSREGLPIEEELTEITKDQQHTCLCLGDLIKDINARSRAEKIWTVYKHHLRMTVYCVCFSSLSSLASIRSNVDSKFDFDCDSAFLRGEESMVRMFDFLRSE